MHSIELLMGHLVVVQTDGESLGVLVEEGLSRGRTGAWLPNARLLGGYMGVDDDHRQRPDFYRFECFAYLWTYEE